MTDGLAMSFDVACSVEHAFATWTTKIGAWWPRDHTVSGRTDALVVLQDGVGGGLAASNPGKLQYASFRLDDGVSFLHVAVVDGDVNPLNSSPAFSDFQAGLKERCAMPPNPVRATVIGSYRLGIE